MLEVLCDGDTSYEAREKAERLLIDFDRVIARQVQKNAMRHWRTYLDGHNRLLERMDQYTAQIPYESPEESLGFLQRAGILDKAGKLIRNNPTWSEDDEA